MPVVSISDSYQNPLMRACRSKRSTPISMCCLETIGSRAAKMALHTLLGTPVRVLAGFTWGTPDFPLTSTMSETVDVRGRLGLEALMTSCDGG